MSEQMYAGAAPGAAAQSQLYNTAAPVQPRQPLFADISERLELLARIMNESENYTASLRERLWGPWPTAGDNAAKGPEARVADATLITLDRLIDTARRVSENAAALSGGLL